MIKKPIEAIKNNIAKTITIVLTIFSIMGGAWAIEDRYSKKQETQNLQEQQEEFQEQQQRFKELQNLSIRERKIEIIRAKLEFYGIMKDEYTKEISDARAWMASHPEEDRDFVNKRIDEIEKSKTRVQQRIDSLMEKLSEVE